MNYFAIPGYATKGFPRNETMLKKIAFFTCEFFGLNEKDFYGKSRKRNHVEARHLYMYYSRTVCKYGLKDIGRIVNRDHTSVIHGVVTMSDLIYTDKHIASENERLSRYLNEKVF